MKFKTDLKMGHKLETQIKNILEEQYGMKIEHCSGSYQTEAADLIDLETGVKFEIKKDETGIFKGTGNFGFEIMNFPSGDASGLRKAYDEGVDYWVHCVPCRNTALVFKTKELYEGLKDLWLDGKVQRVGNTVEGNSTLFVVSFELIAEHFNFIKIKI